MLIIVGGCATDIRAMLSDLDEQQGDVELIKTPFHPQVTDQCGPSALAAVLNASGVPVSTDALKSRIYIPGRQGSLQIELLAASRGYGRMPYVIKPNISALLDEVRGGQPVLVLQNLGRKIAPKWHYSIVVGYLADEKQFVLRSGDQMRQITSASSFIRTWKRAGYWGILVLKPGEMPASPDADSYVRAVAAIEEIGDIDSAIAGYDAATVRWPKHALAQLGLGNSFYAQGDLIAAESAYSKVLSMEPEHLIALNNLSQVQVDRGCVADAAATVDLALSVAPPTSTLYAAFQEARQDIESNNVSAACF
jgi:tetratricopeptide (TPR) repeat protein